LSKAVSPYYPPGFFPTLFSSEVWHWYGPLASGDTVVMVINLSNRVSNILIQWRHIPSFQQSSAKLFRFRDVTRENGWEGYSSIGVGVGGVAPHGSFVLIVSEMTDEEAEVEEFVEYLYNTESDSR
jgi:Alpha galactosidase C-terminal beta sandwich domain